MAHRERGPHQGHAREGQGLPLPHRTAPRRPVRRRPAVYIRRNRIGMVDPGRPSRSYGAFFPLDWDNTPAPDWWENPQAARSGLAPEDTDPFFTQPDGSAFTTSYVRALCQRVAAMAGIAPAEVGAKCLRIGGSIDWREILGDHEGTRIIKQRGRWASDIGEIYQRPLLRSHLLPSMSLGFDSGVDLERICADYAMPRTL